MKRIIWMVGSVLIVVVLGVILSNFGRHRISRPPQGLTTERTGGGARLLSGDLGFRAGTGTEQGLQDASYMDAQVGMPAPQLSEEVKALIGKDDKQHNYSTLLAEINKLSYEISQGDLSALKAMLDYPNSQFPEGMCPIEINAVKNDVLDKLLHQKQLPVGLGLQMAEMAKNADNDPVWRDYCVQFMAPFYERWSQEISPEVQASQFVLSAGEQARMSELTVIHDTMFSALDERSETIAGTALIGLELLSRTHDEFDRELILEKAVEIAVDESASASCRMTALKLAAMNEVKGDVVDTARLLAQTGETVLLRSAAIVTLGEIGEPEDRELINAFQLEGDRQIAGAAKMALAKLDERVVL